MEERYDASSVIHSFLGVQIQYNVSRLEEWCTGHGIAEATLHLQQLLQAAKLLTLNKSSASDIEIIFDVCFLLNATQVKKLLSLYHSADFDSPVCFFVAFFYNNL